ncbi:MAG: helix-turn-helix transcriptional regulator, partial [Tagaea sp.]|nr:helix-turn-helix transcriptional regulator [Tagaea sp.]
FFAAMARRRIDPKDASRIAGCHPKMLGRLRRGESEKLDITYVIAIARSLPDGDAFMAEVTGIAPTAEDTRARIETAALRIAPTLPDSDWWYAPFGDKLPATPNAATVLKLAYRLPSGIDAVRYGLESLGGVLRHGHRIDFEIEHVAHKGLLACAKHLRESFGSETMVVVNDQGLNVRVAINYLEELAADVAGRLSARTYPWNVRRLSLESIQDPLLGAFARDAAGHVDDIASFALRGGMADRCALFNVDGENVTSLWAGASLAVDRAAIIGRNVLDRDDLPYARMVRAHVLEACSEGTVYRDIDIPMNGLRGRYRRVAAAGKRSANGTRQVVTVVQVVGLTPYN